MIDLPVLKIPIRYLAEFVYQQGNLVVSFQGRDKRIQGIIGHQKVQKSKTGEYKAEVSVKYLHQVSDLLVELNGRIDGVIVTEDEIIIEEIKTMSSIKKEEIVFDQIFFKCLQDYAKDIGIMQGKSAVHWAQAMIYAFIYAKLNNLKEISVQLTYYINETFQQYHFKNRFSIVWLEVFFNDLVEQWLEWALKQKNWKELRNLAIEGVGFPYEFRSDQRKMAVGVYRAIKDEKILFVQAPTGTGKTLASIFPALKALGEGHLDKIFYLTAKTVGREVALKTVSLLIMKGLRVKVVVITAKEKACYQDFPLCDPEFCPYAVDYYEKAKQALYEIFNFDIWDFDLINEICLKHQICAFEFSLLISLYADVIICDYNYVFDPRIYLKRFFEEVTEKYCFLIDEAHNLPDRARDSYSTQIDTDMLSVPLSCLKSKKTMLYKKIQFLKDSLSLIAGGYQQNEVLLSEFPENLHEQMKDIMDRLDLWIPKQKPSKMKFQIIQYYFKLYFYLMIVDLVKTGLKPLLYKNEDLITLKMFCINPSGFVKTSLTNSKSASIFSATLIPMSYYEDVIALNENCQSLILQSPFSKDRLGLYIESGINTEYKYRADSYESIAQLIISVTGLKKGNYLVFFPSYHYLHSVLDFISKETEQYDILLQDRKMTEYERLRFLDEFHVERSKSLLSFAVMGGVFGEGIDLVGDKLIGAFIIGVGLPQLSLEKDLIKENYNQEEKNGYDYAYRYPGFNKVLQAGGRVIRTEEDKGIILLIDQRYTQTQYRRLFPREWSHAQSIHNQKTLLERIARFWQE